MDLLTRYLGGEHEAVWRAIAERREVTEEAGAVVHAAMQRVRENAEILRASLESLGYDFDAAPGEERARAFVPVGAPVARSAILDRFQGRGPIPCSLQAFWEVVGHLNFIGALPEEDGWPEPEAVDALQIYSPFAYVHDRAGTTNDLGSGGSLEARLDALLGGDDDAEGEHDEDPHEDFVITLDETMKAGFGGVGPIVMPRGPVVDAPLLFEDAPLRSAAGLPLTFLGYLREGFARGGFFGLSAESHRATIARLTRGLVPF